MTDRSHGDSIPIMSTSPVLKWWRRVLIAGTAVSAAAASFVFLRELALHVGWPVWIAPLLPLSIDLLAAAALTEYRLTRSRTPLVVAVLAIVGSAAGNAYSHLYSTGLAEPGLLAVAGVGTVPAVAVGLTVHLFTARRSAWKPPETDPPGSRPVSASSSVTPSSYPTTRPPTPSTGASDAGRSTGTNGIPAGRPLTTSTTSTANGTPPGSGNGNPPGNWNPTGNGSGSSQPRSITDLASQIYENGWTEKSGNQLVSLLRDSTTGKSVSKGRALAAKREAEALSRASQNGARSSGEEVLV